MKKRFLFRSGLLSVSALALVLVATVREARADIIAVGCEADPDWCKTGPVAFDYSDTLPIEWSFDTGWTPMNSPLQVHLWAGVYATTRVSLKGALETNWPEALTLAVPGAKNGGLLSYHYGVELGAQAKIHITVAGQDYDWIGDIPYVPQFDFQVQGEQVFDAWGWNPGATLSSKTNPQKLVSVGIGDIVGGSIPGIDGGFEVDIALELAATYKTDRIVITTPDGKPVEGGDITEPDGTTKAKYLNGPSVELDVHPEGTCDYDGVIHLIPAFWVELLGKTWNIPIADIPISFPITQTNWNFNPTRVHVPLPDLVPSKTEIDFGEVEVGQKALQGFSLWNAGEARSVVTMVSSSPDLFPAWDPSLNIEPGITTDTAVRFIPVKNGPFEATLYVASNDPSDPVQEILLKGIAFGGPNDTAQDSISEESGCACRQSGEGNPAKTPGMLALAALVSASAWSRRRRVGRS